MSSDPNIDREREKNSVYLTLEEFVTKMMDISEEKRKGLKILNNNIIIIIIGVKGGVSCRHWHVHNSRCKIPRI